MNLRTRIISSVFLVLLLVAATVALLLFNSTRSGAVTISFLDTESTYAPFPLMAESERFTFVCRNDSSKAGAVNLLAFLDQNGNWLSSFHFLGDAPAHQSAQLYLYLPKGSHPTSFRMRLFSQASGVQKAKFAIQMLIHKISGRYPGAIIWPHKLKVPAGDFVVNLSRATEPNRTANANQPLGSDTNQTSTAAASGPSPPR